MAQFNTVHSWFLLMLAASIAAPICRAGDPDTELYACSQKRFVIESEDVLQNKPGVDHLDTPIPLRQQVVGQLGKGGMAFYPAFNQAKKSGLLLVVGNRLQFVPIGANVCWHETSHSTLLHLQSPSQEVVAVIKLDAKALGIARPYLVISCRADGMPFKMETFRSSNDITAVANGLMSQADQATAMHNVDKARTYTERSLYYRDLEARVEAREGAPALKPIGPESFGGIDPDLTQTLQQAIVANLQGLTDYCKLNPPESRDYNPASVDELCHISFDSEYGDARKAGNDAFAACHHEAAQTPPSTDHASGGALHY